MLAVVLMTVAAGLPLRVGAQPVHVTHAELLRVDGTDFSPAPPVLSGLDLQGPWSGVALPHAQSPVLFPQVDDALHPRTSVNWYRIVLPPPVPAANASPAATPRYLYLPRWKMDGQLAVYIDGRLAHRADANRFWNGFNQPVWMALPPADDPLAARTVVLRIAHLRSAGGAVSTAWVGTQEEIGWRYRIRDTLQTQIPLMTSAAFLAVGVFAFFVWARHVVQRQSGGRLHLLFLLMALASYFRNLHYHVGQFKLPISDAWFGWLTVSSLFWLVATGHFFLVQFNRRTRPVLDFAVLGITAAVTVLTLPDAAAVVPGASEIAPAAYAILLAMGVAVFSCGWIDARRAASRDAELMSAWGLLSMGMGMHDWLLQNNHISVESLYLGAYTSSGIFVVFMHALLRQYTHALEDVRLANAQLASRLQAQEAQLTESHARLREVEQRQTLSQERQRLMQDMHDGLGSSLVGALRVVEGGRMQHAEVAEMLKSCIDDLKLAIDSMEPVESDLLLLLATLRYRLGGRLKSSGIQLVWDVQEVPAIAWLDPRNSLHILRILQEALANILKHAGATEIRISTHAGNGDILVVVSDNGAGYEVNNALQKGGHGLANQRRRAQAIGADVLFTSSPAGSAMTLVLRQHRMPAVAPVLASNPRTLA